MGRYFWKIVLAVAVVLFLFGGTLLRLYTDWLWFQDVGFAAIFSRTLWIKLALFLASAAAFFVIVFTNLRLARRIAPFPTERLVYADELRERLAIYARRGLGALITLAAIVLSIMAGLAATSRWDDLLRFVYGGAFGGQPDPIFHRDLGFYVFKLPFLRYIYGWLFFALFVSGAAVVALYYMGRAIEFLANIPRFAPRVKAHVFTIIALLFLLRAWGYWLDRYGLLLTDSTLIPGPGYADIHGRLPALYVLMAACVLAALLTLVNIPRRGIWLAAGGLIGVLVVSFALGVAYPGALQQFVVKPNPLDTERRFITYGIDGTRRAYGLTNIETRSYPAADTLSAAEIAANQPTIRNVRLWDYKPLQSDYEQMQELQQYYKFNDVDIDRYTINGEYRQVMLSARELEQQSLPDQAKVWLNLHLVYTHGYGVVMSPVNEVSPQGLPVYFIKDIPPISSVDLKVREPAVYFGELTDSYALVKTKPPSVKYTSKDAMIETDYQADRGIRIGSYWRKLLFSTRLGDVNMLITPNITRDSRLLFRRAISERVSKLFPFLRFDNDPYLVLSNGRMFWIQDAYTTSSQVPYSQQSEIQFNYTPFMDSFNYIRNSVKITVDAYTGDVHAYYDDRDPIIQTYARAFKGVFKPFSRMPREVRVHVRYPEDLFSVQAEVYNVYHMTDPAVFFQKSDLWERPEWMEMGGNKEVLGSRRVDPYYLIMRLPGAKNEEFILLRPSKRAGKENMVAWICAKCDPDDYGDLLVYTFGQGRLAYGPNQVESRINVDPAISKELSLWRQGGSTVILGNMLAIPIEKAIMYVQPLYLEATTGARIPQFTRVIVALGDKIAMEPTLDEAIARVIGGPAPPAAAPRAPVAGARAPVPEPAAPAPPADTRTLVRQAADHFKKAQEAQRRGDWAAYGEELRRLERTLTEMQRRSSER
ncbi:MAG: UPF0182 family protein [Armatimonadota bacterium]|nr:UPF0182 family protein [Armatimonadota bacterium]